MEINSMEMRQIAINDHLNQAIDSITLNRRYWSGGISRAVRGHLATLLKEKGFDVHYFELPPHWEHVFFLGEDFATTPNYREVLRNIAIERAEHVFTEDESIKLPI